ncbi:MAG: nicotinamide mononucleotide transporter [Bacteroidales bacterium]|nr:nicotinamide mononucleotide transporter [Bacteroidales bacterium]
MTEKQFNKWFNTFILVGMTVVTVLVTGIKLRGADGGEWLLLMSALGSLMGVLATVCSANGWIITFLFGFFDVSIYGVACWINWRDGGSGLGNALLHFLYFVPMQLVGFLQWKKRGAKGESQVKARRLTPAMRWAWLGITLAATAVLYVILLRFDRSAAEGFLRVAVLLDVVPLVCNVIGQLLMSTAYMEQWIFWIAVNIFSIGLWLTSDKSFAPVYIVKYAFYLINSLNGLRIWLNLSRPAGEGVDAGGTLN